MARGEQNMPLLLNNFFFFKCVLDDSWQEVAQLLGQMGEARSGPSSQLQRRKSAPRRQLKRKMGEVTRKTEHWSSSAYGVRQHIKKNPLIQCAGQMFPVCVFTGNAHLFPSEMS